MGTLVVAFLGALGAALHACRADRWLDNLGPSAENDGQTPDRKKPPTPPKDEPSSRKKPPRPTGGDAHVALGIPEDGSPSDDHLIRKPQYILSYNRDQNVANWVSWELNAAWFGDTPRHKGKFMEDPDLPPGFYRVKHDDYTNSGFDRGHMVRSEERTRNAEDNRATFFTTNILPQYHDLNAGPWLRLEERCEELSRRQGKQLYVMAGPILRRGKKPSRTIGHDVAVPDTFFKIAVILEPGQGPDDVTNTTEVLAAIMPNQEGILGEGWEQYRTTIDEIEKRTGYEFLSAVPVGVQKVIEAKKSD